MIKLHKDDLNSIVAGKLLSLPDLPIMKDNFNITIEDDDSENENEIKINLSALTLMMNTPILKIPFKFYPK